MSKTVQTEEEFLRDYDPTAFERPNTIVDTVIFTVLDGQQVLKVKHENHPYKDKWSLVGGQLPTSILHLYQLIKYNCKPVKVP